MTVRARWITPLVALTGLLMTVSACSSTHAASPQGARQQAVSPAGQSTALALTGPAASPVTVPPITSSPSGSSTARPSTSDSASTSSVLPDSATPTVPDTPTTSPPPEIPPVATVSATPALGSTDVSPVAPIAISVAQGTISSLTFTNAAEGVAVEGALAADHTSWTLTQPLGYGKTYAVAGTAVGTDGKSVPITGTYSTLRTIEPITTSISPGSGAVVGVGAPVIVRFGLNPKDKALIEKHVIITTTPKVDGSWAWVTHDGDSYPSLDFRPKDFWPAGTKVHVESDIYGLNFSGGYYGGDNAVSDFTIGRNQVTYADAQTHMVTVKRDGTTVATYPASLGMGDNPNSAYGLNKNFVTRSGTYIVMDKQQKILMSNPKPGGGWYYHNVPEYWAVRISNDGEFLHYNDGTTSHQLGHVNITHGCVNLGEADAKAYFEMAIYGDPVVVTGTSVALGPSDGDIYDWAIPWETWSKMSALAPDSIIH